MLTRVRDDGAVTAAGPTPTRRTWRTAGWRAFLVLVALANIALAGAVANANLPGPMPPGRAVVAAAAPSASTGGPSAGAIAVVAVLIGLVLVVFWRAVVAVLLAGVVGVVLFVMIMVGVWAGGGPQAEGGPGAAVVREV